MNKKSQFVYVARFVDPAKAAVFLKKGFAGIASYPEELRTYPQNGVAAQVLGFAGTDQHGLGGLELQYDHKLAGRPGTQTIVRDPTGRAIDTISSRPVQEGVERLHDARPHDPGAGREGAARHGRPVRREGRDRDRARPVDRRDPRDGPDARATTRTTRRTSRATRRRSCATAPSPTRTSPARPSSS